MTGPRHIVILESGESQGARSELRDVQFQWTSNVLLGICVVAMLVDLLALVAAVSGLADATFYFSWLLIVSVPANVGGLVLFPIGAYLARRSARGPTTTGLSFHLMSTTVGLFTLKMSIYWGGGLVMGIERARWLLITAVAIGASALWAWRRARASGTTFRPAYYLVAVLCGIALTEFAVWGVRKI